MIFTNNGSKHPVWWLLFLLIGTAVFVKYGAWFILEWLLKLL